MKSVVRNGSYSGDLSMWIKTQDNQHDPGVVWVKTVQSESSLVEKLARLAKKITPCSLAQTIGDAFPNASVQRQLQRMTSYRFQS